MPAKKSAKKSSRKKKPNPIPVPPAGDWRSTDQEEIHRRTQRAIDEKHSITNLHPEHPVFSTFAIASPSGMSYQVEIRDLAGRSFSCTCPDFRRNGLGTCKHTEATLIWLKRRLKGEFRDAEKSGSPRADLVPAGETLRIERNLDKLTPASLKSEWEDQIGKFTTLSQRVIFGPRSARTSYYADSNPPFFTIVNYEQVVSDSLDINERLRPDIVVLDEAQRIKNWATKTAQAIKRLKSRYAFVLTGTPIENRIDELYSIVDFLDPSIFGPLFRFNRDFYELDERGRPKDYKNLAAMRERVRPVILRRRKHHVETELPERTDVNHFVKLTPAMREEYEEIKQQVSKLTAQAAKRPLKKEERELLMILLAMMRMICDSPSIIKNRDCQDCPKMKELAGILEDALVDPDVKIIVFSEWEGMLKKVREWAEKTGTGYAWHTGSVPQQNRRKEIRAFHDDPALAFVEKTTATLGSNLIHCQEAMLPGENTPVLLTVLRDPARTFAVAEIFNETNWQGNPPKHQVIDEATWDAIQRLAQTGLLTLNTRATRHLTGDQPAKPTLTPEQIQRITDLRTLAAKKQKAADLLTQADLPDEAETQRKEAEKALAEATAVERQYGEGG